MKKLILALPIVAMMTSNTAWANNSQKIAFVKKVYASSKANQDGTGTLRRFGTSSLIAQLNRQDRNWANDNYCGIGEDPLYGNQDPNYRLAVSYRVNGNGNVVATVGGSYSATFALAKSGNSYKIDDVYYHGSSVKKMINADCY